MHGVRAFLHQFDSGMVQTDSWAAGEHVLPSAHLAWHTSSWRKARALLAPDRGHGKSPRPPLLAGGWARAAARHSKQAGWKRRQPGLEGTRWTQSFGLRVTDTALTLIKPVIGAAKHSCSPCPATHTVLRAPRLRPRGEARKPSGKMK